MDKTTIAQVAEKFRIKGYILLDEEYIDNNSKMTCIDEYDYKYFKSYNNLLNIIRTNGKFPIINVDNPYSIDNINNYIKINKIETELVSNLYLKNNATMTFKCKCGELYETTWASFYGRNKHACNKCAKLKQSAEQKLSYKYVKDFINKDGNELISEAYCNISKKLEIKCKCGNIFHRNFNNYRNKEYGSLCNDCIKLEMISKKKERAKNSYFNDSFFPCDSCSKECNGISTCKIFAYFKSNKIQNIKNGSLWNGNEYVEIIDFVYNKKSKILDDLIDFIDNKSMDDVMNLITHTLPLTNTSNLKVKKRCSCCGKTVLRKRYMYNSKYCYCSPECKTQQSVLMMNNGDIKFTRTIPHVKVCDLLTSMGYSYSEEHLIKYQSVDIFSKEHDLYIEVMGDYWHGNPLKYDYQELNDSQLYDIVKDRTKYVYSKKYMSNRILYLWETDINTNIDMCQKLIELYISQNGILDDYQSYNYHTDCIGNLRLNEHVINPYFINYKSIS